MKQHLSPICLVVLVGWHSAACSEGDGERVDEPSTTNGSVLPPVTSGSTEPSPDPSSSEPSPTGVAPSPPPPSPSPNPTPSPRSGPDPLPPQGDRGCTPSDVSSSGTLNGPFGSTRINAGGQEYFLQVNQWNPEGQNPPQIVDYGGDFVFQVTQQGASVPTNGGPVGYPSLFIGSNYGNTTAGSGLPMQVSSLTSVPTTWIWDDAGTIEDVGVNSYNVAYDVWFSQTAAGDNTNPSGGYLMVWLYDPPDAQPIGSPSGHTDIEVANVPGRWDAWIGTNGSTPIVSYVARQPMMGLSFDLMDFIQDSIDNRDTLSPNLYLSNVFIGFEIWRGGAGLRTTEFCVQVN